MKKINKDLIKKTYLEQIEIDQQKRKVPGVCSYSLDRSQKDIENEKAELAKKKRAFEERRFFFDDTELLSGTTPGVGNYNPHDIVKKFRINKTDPKLWK